MKIMRRALMKIVVVAAGILSGLTLYAMLYFFYRALPVLFFAGSILLGIFAALQTYAKESNDLHHSS